MGLFCNTKDISETEIMIEGLKDLRIEEFLSADRQAILKLQTIFNYKITISKPIIKTYYFDSLFWSFGVVIYL